MKKLLFLALFIIIAIGISAQKQYYQGGVEYKKRNANGKIEITPGANSDITFNDSMTLRYNKGALKIIPKTGNGSAILKASDTTHLSARINLKTTPAQVNDSILKHIPGAVSSTEVGYLDGVTSGIQGQINNVKSGIYNVLYFGAKADGTDDQPEIQAALTAGIGGTVYLPKGIYYISAPLVFGSNTIIKGDGPENTIIKIRTNWANSDEPILAPLNNTHDTRIKDLCLNGNKTAFVHGPPRKKMSYGIYTYYNGYRATQNITIENVEITNVSDHGVAIIGNNNRNWNFENCYIHACGDTMAGAGIYAGGKINGLRINNCKIDSCWDQGVYFSSGTNVTISNNHIMYNGLDGSGTGVSMRADSNTVISDNIIMYNAGTGLDLIRGLYPTQHNQKNIIVTGNTISHNGVGGTEHGQVYVYEVERVIIANNNIGPCDGVGTSYFGIYIYDEGLNLTISDNNIFAYYGINLDGDSLYNINIRGNSLRSTVLYAGTGIYMQAVSPGGPVVISNNTFNNYNIDMYLTSSWTIPYTIIKNNVDRNFGNYSILNSSLATLHNIEYKGNSSFTTNATRKGIRITGLNTDYDIIVTPIAVDNLTRPSTNDFINGFCKADSVIFMRPAGTTSGLRFKYVINNDDL